MPALRQAAPGCVIVPIDSVTEGAACTVLLAERAIDPDDPLVIANSDQWVDRYDRRSPGASCATSTSTA